MEFLRFGSSIPGGYWGCCAACIIQNFKMDPKDKASIQLVSGDSGSALGDKYVGPTYEDIFRARIRIGTFSDRDMPNHAFFAILTKDQVNGSHGAKWLKILKEEGFEFIRSVDNSVYSGASTIKKEGEGSESHANYIFALFRNIGTGAMKDPLTPPAAWTALSSVVPEAWESIDPAARKQINLGQQKFGIERWAKTSPTKIMTKAQIKAAGAPVVLAGTRKEGAAPHVEVVTAPKASPFKGEKAA